MEETKLTAALPNLDVEILHKALPDEGAEMITMRLRATPSFDAVAGAMGPALPALMAPALAQAMARTAMMPMAAAATFWLAPLQAWAGLVQQGWAPLLSAMTPPNGRIGRE